MIDVGGPKAQATVGAMTPGQVVLGCTRKQADHASKQSSFPPGSLLEFLPLGFAVLVFLPWLPSVTDYNQYL